MKLFSKSNEVFQRKSYFKTYINVNKSYEIQAVFRSQFYVVSWKKKYILQDREL